MKKAMWRWADRVLVGVTLGLVVALLAGCAAPNNGGSTSGKFSDPPQDLFPQGTNDVPSAGGGGLAMLAGDYGNRFEVGDMVKVKFSETIDQNLLPHEERIKEDGNITLTYIGAIKAAGKTPGELQKDIHARYVPDYYKRLNVTVEGDQRVYYVGGYVRSPGRQVYLGRTTVTKAIQSAGDFNDYGSRRKVELTRRDGDFFIVDCVKAAKDPSLDLPVFPGDKIHVPMRGFGEIW